VKRLSDEVRLHVVYSDATRFGSHVSRRFDQELRVRLQPVMAAIEKRGLNPVIPLSESLLASALAAPSAAELFAAPHRLHEHVLYPTPSLVRPARLLVEKANRMLAALDLSPSLVPELALWFGDWQRGAEPPASGPARSLYLELEHLGALTDSPALPVLESPAELTLVGHATVLVRFHGSSVLVDPFLFGLTAKDPIQPLAISELGALDAVLVTHSHPDHFDLGSLLRLGAATPIYVPEVARESLLSIDMAARLRELGFENVRTLRWWETERCGGIEVTAMPFYGEQPTVECVPQDEVANVGNTYHLKLGDRSLGLTVDSGRDHRGSPQSLAREARARLGMLDAVCGGHRGFAFYPVQYLLSSVPNYLLFVPPEQRGIRQRIMCNAEELLDAAEAWGARGVVPYAGGGAPWYWRIGLGPTLDGTRPVERSVDPEPEQVEEVAAQRSWSSRDGHVASSAAVYVLRPSDGLRLDAELGTVRTRRWPYAVTPAPRTLDDVACFAGRFDVDELRSRPNSALSRSGDSVAWLKKKALLGMLARCYAAQHGIFPSRAEVQQTSDNFRVRFGLTDEATTLGFFRELNIDDEIWCEVMTDIAAIEGVERRYLDAVLARVPAVERVWSARGRKGGFSS
jgi:L-ascorbate metabolism protein UlaG (beta-lactamase superfamily)